MLSSEGFESCKPFTSCWHDLKLTLFLSLVNYYIRHQFHFTEQHMFCTIIALIVPV